LHAHTKENNKQLVRTGGHRPCKTAVVSAVKVQ